LAIPQEIIDAVRERVSIAEIISEKVTLKRVGRNLVGLCPFHQEKSPSFNVREEEASFYCFGCGKKGSVFDFIMETRGFTFVETVTLLANKIGLKIPESSSWSPRDKERSQGDNQKREWHRRLAFLVAEVYGDVLWNSVEGERAREYLRGRGIEEITARLFNVGYAPPAWEFLVKRLRNFDERLSSWGITELEQNLPKLLAELGLIKKREREATATEGATEVSTERARIETPNYFDLFRGRLMFGITRSDGAIIGFGGRLTEKKEDSPKYINSPESPIYQKRKTFFGISQAMTAIRRSSHVYLVEGYLDVLSMVQRGLADTVATCGTAFTPEHVLVLKRLVNKATVVFDGDNAGRKAAAHSFEVFLNSGIEVSAVLLEGGEDPDSLAQKLSQEDLLQLFAAARTPLIQVFVEQKFIEFGGERKGAGPVLMGRVAEATAKLIAQVANPVEREVLTRDAATLIGVGEESFRGTYRNTQGDRTASSDSSRRPVSDDTHYQTQRGSGGGYSQSNWNSRPKISPARPVAPSTASFSAEGLESFARSVVVAVLIEPTLVDELMNLRAQQDPSQLVCDLLPESVRSFIAEVREERPEPVEDNPRWRRLLENSQLGKYRLLEEALERAPFVLRGREKMVDELRRQAPRATSRRTIKSEMEQIRASEKGDINELERAKLMQQKLLQRRRLDELVKK